MAKSFDYQDFDVPDSFAEPGETKIFRPVLPLILYGKTKGYPIKALVDTGAIESVLPWSFIEEGWIDPRFDGEEVDYLEAANGSEFKVTYGLIDMELRLGPGEVYRWGMKVGFSKEREEPVLGDAWFFRFFDVFFRRHEKKFIVDFSRDFLASGGTLPAPIQFDV